MNLKNPWDQITDVDETGESNHDLIFVSVGRALTSWESMLSLFSLAFIDLVEIANYGLQRAIETQTSAITKADMFLYASREILRENESLRVDAKSLANKVTRFNQRRNDIAHGCVTQIEATKNGNVYIEGYYLCPSSTDAKKHKSIFEKFVDPLDSWAYRWTTKQIDYYEDQFSQLGLEIVDFIKKLRALRTSSPDK